MDDPKTRYQLFHDMIRTIDAQHVRRLRRIDRDYYLGCILIVVITLVCVFV